MRALTDAKKREREEGAAPSRENVSARAYLERKTPAQKKS